MEKSRPNESDPVTDLKRVAHDNCLSRRTVLNFFKQQSFVKRLFDKKFSIDSQIKRFMYDQMAIIEDFVFVGVFLITLIFRMVAL